VTALRSFLNRPVVNAVLVGAAVALALCTVTFAGLFFIELVMATVFSHSPLPPPTNVGVEAIVVLVSVGVGGYAGRRWFRKDAYSVLWESIATIAGALVVLVGTGVLAHGYTARHENSYLSEGYPYYHEMTPATFMDNGRQACNWLEGRHWGAPPDLRGRAYGVLRGNSAAWSGAPTSNVISSTRRLLVFYSRFIDRENPGPVTRDDEHKRDVALWAWYKLCPFQQWVHRPLGNGGD
jgi:hypothetical protein